MEDKDKPTKIVPLQSPALTLADPAAIVENATKAAHALKDILDSKKDKLIINKKQYLFYEDWQMIGQFYGVSPKVEWSKPLMDGKKFLGYEARAVAINRNGDEISAAEAMCLDGESDQWTGKPQFQIRSMAQTRALAKCLRNIFGGVAVLGGYQPTPAEEVQDTGTGDNSSSSNSSADAGDSKGATPKQITFIRKNFSWKKISVKEFEDQYKPIDELSLKEAISLLDFLFNKENKTPTLAEAIAATSDLPPEDDKKEEKSEELKEEPEDKGNNEEEEKFIEDAEPVEEDK